MKKRIAIEGMSCGHCVNHVKEALLEFKVMGEVEVDLDSKSALIEFSEDITDEELKAAIEDVGYDVLKIETI